MGSEQPPVQVSTPTPPKDRWPVVRRWLLGAAAVFALGLAAAALLSGEPQYTLAAWVFASLPIVYLVIAAARRTLAPAAGIGMAAGLALILGASTFVTVTSCGNRLEPGADLSGCDLRDEGLAGLDLSGADLSSADMTGLDLTGTSFNNANLSGADLRESTVQATLMNETDLEGTNLESLDLTNAELAPTSLADAILDGADLAGVRLVSISLANATAMGTNLTNANLSGSDLTGTQLAGATLDGATLIGTTGVDNAGLAAALGVPIETLAGTLTEKQIRLEARDDILAALGPPCSGQGVEGATPFPTSDFHPMVVLDERGQVGPDTDQGADLGWEPMAVEFDQLVACVSEEEDEQVEHCPYTIEGGGTASITRVQYHRDVRVVSASDGGVVFEKTLRGSNPPECPLVHTFSSANQNETFGGSNVGFDKVKKEIARFVS